MAKSNLDVLRGADKKSLVDRRPGTVHHETPMQRVPKRLLDEAAALLERTRPRTKKVVSGANQKVSPEQAMDVLEAAQQKGGLDATLQFRVLRLADVIREARPAVKETLKKGQPKRHNPVLAALGKLDRIHEG